MGSQADLYICPDCGLQPLGDLVCCIVHLALWLGKSSWQHMDRSCPSADVVPRVHRLTESVKSQHAGGIGQGSDPRASLGCVYS
jgi:hypothetical protein